MRNSTLLDAPPDAFLAGSLDEVARTADALNEEVDGKPLRRIALDNEGPTNGLAHLVLTLIKLLHDLLEKQAIRRMENGSLTEEEVERVGHALMQQVQELEQLCETFDLDYDDLGIQLGTVEHAG
jgi:hypothetical protein